ncbi:MAG: S46 family peptidase [Bacteroidales bacterium]|jgi:molybdenum-dependent DNA-binding transcriptional regulator ModE
MKKLSFILCAMLLLGGNVRADEGMWLLPLLNQLNSKGMKEAGLMLDADDIYNINHSSLKDAIVIFGGGCTGEVVSPEGLLLTNHHCGYGMIQALSSVEHNYLKDGFWARNREEEIPAPGLRVTFMESMSEVTKEVLAVLDTCSSEESRGATEGKLVREWGDKVRKENPHLNGRLYSMYGGNQYYLVVYKVYTDVRFVGAPPSSIGKFGADTDNWMWPRHTCDFSMFRIYAGPDNEPADYAPENRPYRAKYSLPISLKGVQQGDFVMTLGYPGTTTRYMTSIEVDRQEQLTNNIGIEVRTIRQNILLEDMLADPKVQLQYASKYSGSTNAWKKWTGMNETFGKLHVKARRAAEEAAFTAWVNAGKKRIEKYGTALKDIEEAIRGTWDNLYVSRYLSEALRNIELASFASRAARLVSRPLEDGSVDTKGLKAQAERFFTNYNAPTDVKVAKAMLKHFALKVDKAHYPSVYGIIDNEFSGNIDAYVEHLFEKSLFVSAERVNCLIDCLSAENTREAALQEITADPAVLLGQSVEAKNAECQAVIVPYFLQYERGHRSFIAGMMEMNKGTVMYPDANSSMRLTYGNVLNYKPKDGVIYDYYTTLTGVMEKEDPDNWEFVVPEKLKQLYNKKDYGQYAQPGQEIVTGFIANTDITGGNSGSPVLNAHGELIGLAFDGNWESMSGDVIFEPALQRCISVDIRYVLFIMDKYGEAGYLLEEMNIRK